MKFRVIAEFAYGFLMDFIIVLDAKYHNNSMLAQSVSIIRTQNKINWLNIDYEFRILVVN